MKNDIYGKIKARKPFEVNDVIVYLFLLVLVTLLFLFFVILPKTNVASGFKVIVNDKEFLSFYYETESCVLAENSWALIDHNKENGTITIYHNADKTEYNVLSYDTDKHIVSMLDSTCSLSKDCIYEPEISSNGAIYCAPHKLIVIPISDGKEIPPPTIGGGL